MPTSSDLPTNVEKHRDDAITMAALLSDLKSRPETKSICRKAVPIEREMEIVRHSSNRLCTIGQYPSGAYSSGETATDLSS